VRKKEAHKEVKFVRFPRDRGREPVIKFESIMLREREREECENKLLVRRRRETRRTWR
jgi:hypothetical protein